MSTTSYDMRPMSLGDIIDRTFSLYQANFALFAGVVAVLAIPQAVLNWALGAAGGPFATGSGKHVHFHGGAFLALFLSSVISLIFASLITAGLARAVSARYLGREMTISEAYAGVGAATLITLVVASILYGIAVGIGLILLIIPGIYIGVLFAFFTQAIVLERADIFGSFGRSAELVRGSWWRVFGIILLVVIAVGIVQGIVAGVVGNFVSSASFLGAIVSAIIGIFFKPIQLGALTLLYYDLRVRKENFTVDHLAGHLTGGEASYQPQ